MFCNLAKINKPTKSKNTVFSHILSEKLVWKWMEEKKLNIYLCLNSVHLQWQIRRNTSSWGIFGSSEQEVFEGGRWGWGSPIDHSQVITGGFAPKLVKNIGAGSEEVRVRHSSSQVDGGVCSSVRLSLRSSRSHDRSSSSWHPENSKGMCSCVSGSLTVPVPIKCSRLCRTFRHRIGTFPNWEQPLLHQQLQPWTV